MDINDSYEQQINQFNDELSAAISWLRDRSAALAFIQMRQVARNHREIMAVLDRVDYGQLD